MYNTRGRERGEGKKRDKEGGERERESRERQKEEGVYIPIIRVDSNDSLSFIIIL